MNTSDFAYHDKCSRFRTWSERYELPRIPLSDALNTSLRAGLLAGDQAAAYTKFMALAANPGLDIDGGRIYDIAVHHAQMLEVLTSYLVTDGPWMPAEAVPFNGDTYEPLSYQLPDGRLRRVVLCSSWNSLREQEEKTSWWSVGDMAVTGRPMLVNVLVIGSAKGGFRQSPWTTGYIHPENGILRIRKKDGVFTDRWKKVYRENTDLRSLDWLTKMQQDAAFEGIVESFTLDGVDKGVLKDMERMKFGGTEMRRSACFRNVPCVMAELCHRGLNPARANWREKPLVQLLTMVK
jgi:hypothetical protein